MIVLAADGWTGVSLDCFLAICDLELLQLQLLVEDIEQVVVVIA